MSQSIKVMGEMPLVVQLASMRQIQTVLRAVPPARQPEMTKMLVHLLAEDSARVHAARGELTAAERKDPILEGMRATGSGFEFFQLYVDNHIADMEQRCRAPKFVQTLVSWYLERKSRAHHDAAEQHIVSVREQLLTDRRPDQDE